MAFTDLPIVDENSKASEESVHAVKGFFSKRNGFISREEAPDYGCDLDVELIVEGSGASSNKFPIQIKSCGGYSLVDGNQYLSHSFETSRLGYLCKRSPAPGMVVFYDDTLKKCFFDYTENIVERLNIKRGGDEWKANKTVAIHIPVVNVVSDDSVQAIHKLLSTRFENHQALVNRHGKDFDIPSFFERTNDKYLSPSELLQKYGMLLLNGFQIARLAELLEGMTSREITGSKELLLIACVVYAERGMCIDADFYFSKAALIIDELDQREKEILRFSKIKVDHLSGKRSIQEYHSDIKELIEATTSENNKILLQINLFYFQVLEAITKISFNKEFQLELIAFLQIIDDSGLETEKKWLYKVNQSANVHAYMSTWMLNKIIRIRTREKLNQKVPDSEKIAVIEEHNKIMNQIVLLILNAHKYSTTTKDKLLYATSLCALGRSFQTKELDMFLLHFEDRRNMELLEENYCREIAGSIQAHNVFLELDLVKEARSALIIARDLFKLSRIHYGMVLTSNSTNEQNVSVRIDEYGKEMGLEVPDISPVEMELEGYQANEGEGHEAPILRMTDEQVVDYATFLQESLEIPSDRIVNIVGELKSFRHFYKNMNDAKYVLFSNQNEMTPTNIRHLTPSRFVIVNMQNGLQSQEDTDIDRLMKSFCL